MAVQERWRTALRIVITTCCLLFFIVARNTKKIVEAHLRYMNVR